MPCEEEEDDCQPISESSLERPQTLLPSYLILLTSYIIPHTSYIILHTSDFFPQKNVNPFLKVVLGCVSRHASRRGNRGGGGLTGKGREPRSSRPYLSG